MLEKIFLPEKITIKSRPHGYNNQLFLTMDYGEEKISSFVTRELCSVILGFLEKQEPMNCEFKNGQLICVKNRIICDSQKFSDLIPDFQATPFSLTLYSTRTKVNLYAYLRVEKLTLAGFVDQAWVMRVVDGIVTRSPLLFKTEDDPRENIRKLTSNVLPVAVVTEPQPIAYYKQ